MRLEEESREHKLPCNVTDRSINLDDYVALCEAQALLMSQTLSQTFKAAA